MISALDLDNPEMRARYPASESSRLEMRVALKSVTGFVR